LLEVDSVRCRGERQRERAPGQKGVNAREPGRSNLVQQESAGLANEPGLSKNWQIEQKVSHSKIGRSKSRPLKNQPLKKSAAQKSAAQKSATR
jgi:hypothetical protein